MLGDPLIGLRGPGSNQWPHCGSFVSDCLIREIIGDSPQRLQGSFGQNDGPSNSYIGEECGSDRSNDRRYRPSATSRSGSRGSGEEGSVKIRLLKRTSSKNKINVNDRLDQAVKSLDTLNDRLLGVTESLDRATTSLSEKQKKNE